MSFIIPFATIEQYTNPIQETIELQWDKYNINVTIDETVQVKKTSVILSMITC